MLCFIAPFAEEVVYRSFVFRPLYRRARLATIVVAVLLTIYKDKIWKPLLSEEENVSDTLEPRVEQGKQMRLHAGPMW